MKKNIIQNQPFQLFLSVLILSFVTFVVYVPALNVGFYMDDFSSIVNNPVVHNFSWEAVNSAFPMRELGYASFAMNYQMSGLNPFYLHLTNIFLHICSGIVCFYFVLLVQKKLSSDKEPSLVLPLFAALLFLILPLNTQPVVYVVQRLTLLSALFYLLSLVFYLQFRMAKRPGRYLFLVLVFFSFLAGMHSKQNIATLPVVILLFEYFLFKSISTKRLWTIFFAVFMVFALAQLMDFVLKLGLLAKIDSATRLTDEYTRWEYFTQQFTSIFNYLYKFFIPAPLRLEYGIIPNTWQNWQTWVGLFIVIGLIVAIVRNRTQNPLISLMLSLYLVLHSVESSLLPILDFNVEHRAYLPNVALSILVVYLVLIYTKRFNQKFIFVTTLGLLAFYSSITVERLRLWQEPVEFYRHELAYLGNSARLYAGLAGAFAMNGEVSKAEVWFKNAMVTGIQTRRLDSDLVATYISILNEQGNEGLAKVIGAKALKAFSWPTDKAKILSSVATLDVNQGQCDFAMGMIKRALKYHPENLQANELKKVCEQLSAN